MPDQGQFRTPAHRWLRLLTFLLTLLTALGTSLVMTSSPAAAIGPNAIRAVSAGTTFAANDDSSLQVNLPFSINYFGTPYSRVFLNNNGNLTFDTALGTYTPFDLSTNHTKIIAPFFADVLTTIGSPATYGSLTVDGRPGWAATWPGVGCYQSPGGGLNNFQVVLVNRADAGAGDFDIEFNYDRIVWDSGTASGGDSGCKNGSSARAGFSDGTSANSYELPGSGVRSSFIDSTTATSLVGHSAGTSQPGRYIFPVRNGQPVQRPQVGVTGVRDGETYNRGAVPAAGCTVTDAQDGTVQVSPTLSAVSGPRGAAGLGEQTATCRYTNSVNVSTSVTATYTIADLLAPVVTVPSSAVVAEATAAVGAPVTFGSSAADAVDGSTSTVCAPASGATFPLGSTTVDCASTDLAGNTGHASLVVRVVDTTAPRIDARSASAAATSVAGAPVTYSAPTHDLVDGDGVAACSPASGSTFPLGTTTVDCTADDAAGNRSTESFTVTVQDRGAPVVHVPANLTVEATGPDGAVASWSPVVAVDDVDNDLVSTCSPTSGSSFPFGTTTVECAASDHAGNTGRGSFNVAVVDTSAPMVHVPDDITSEATSATGAAVDYDSSAHDTVSGGLPTECDTPSGADFPIGDTTVTCRATDAAGNPGTASFTVTVRDTTAPSLTVSDDLVAEATSASGADVNYDAAQAVDTVDGTVGTSCAPGSGTAFSLGRTMVSCTATDAAGNTATKRFAVTVRDTTAPTLAVPANLLVPATSVDGATATFPPATASDSVDAHPSVTCDPASGSRFRIGTTSVRCSASDSAGNESTGSFTVTVQDQGKPVVSVPADVTIEATGPDGAPVTWTGVGARDDVEGALPATCDRASGSTFPLGTTTVTCTATDSAGNTGRLAFTVTVRDTTAPALTVANALTATASSSSGAPVSFISPSATDLVSGAVGATCDRRSGATYALGTTTVTCTATDPAGNTATKTFTITVTYGWSGFREPVNAGETYKLGSTIPLKFMLAAASAGVGDADARLFVTQAPATGQASELSGAASGNANTGNAFRAADGQYIFNWSTKNLAGGTWRIRVELGDGSIHVVTIVLR